MSNQQGKALKEKRWHTRTSRLGAQQSLSNKHRQGYNPILAQ